MSGTIAQASSNKIVVQNQIDRTFLKDFSLTDFSCIVAQKLIPVGAVLTIDRIFVTSDSFNCVDLAFKATAATSIFYSSCVDDIDTAHAATKIAWITVVAHWLYRQFDPVVPVEPVSSVVTVDLVSPVGKNKRRATKQ